MFKQYWLTKSSHWAYEKEWRAITKVDRDDKPGYALLNIYPEEIDTLFLGCRMPDHVKANIMGRLTGALAHVSVMQARRSDTHFVLQFDTIR